jgi:hypothetical protein
MVNLEMLRLLRRVDSFLGADSIDTRGVLNELFDKIVTISQEHVDFLNGLNKSFLERSRTSVITRIKEMIFVHMSSVETNFSMTNGLDLAHKNRFSDALLCHVYHKIDETVRDVMSGNNFFKDMGYLKTMDRYCLNNTSCMKTKQSVLEYAVCEDTVAYCRNYICLCTWFDSIAPTACDLIMDLNRSFSQHQTDQNIDELITKQANAIQQDYLNRVEELYKKPNTTSKNHREQFFDALLCHIYHQIILDVRSIIIRSNIFSVSLLKTTRAMSLLGTPCMKTRAEVLDYAVCCDTKAYWETFDRNR